MVTKAEANYRIASADESPCSACKNFVAPDSCALVSGAVAAAGTCDLFQPENQQGQAGGTDSIMDQLFGNTKTGD